MLCLQNKRWIKNYVLGALKNCDYSRAKMLAEDLSDEGEFCFLKMLLLNYFVGINFNYEDFYNEYNEWDKKIEKYICETLKRRAKLAVVDILENIGRRIKNSEYLEAAIQIKLIFHHQINPWDSKYTFKSGFDKLNELEGNKYKEVENYCKTLAHLRNSSFLEHFFSPDNAHAEKAVECAENIVPKTFGPIKRGVRKIKKTSEERGR
jgi:hypothetical protein